MKVNIAKTKVTHFRQSRYRCTDYNFRLSDKTLETVNKYK